MYPESSTSISRGRAALLCLAAALAIAIVALGYWKRQPQIEVNGGLGWDGRNYAHMYSSAAGREHAGNEQPAVFPFCKRIGLPLLAAAVPGTNGFRLINILSGFVAAFAIFTLALRRVGFVRAAAVTAPLVFYLFAPIRFSNFYPWTVDPPVMAMMALAVVALERRWFVATIALLVIATPFKEICFYFSIVAIACYVLFAVERSVMTRAAVSIGALIACVVAASAYKHYYPDCNGSSLRTIVEYGVQLVSDPWRFFTVVAGILLTAGPFLFRFRMSAAIESARLHPALWFGGVSFLLSVAMAAVGGLDSTRLFFVCYPLVVPVLLFALARLTVGTTVVLALAGLLINRWLTSIPQPDSANTDLGSFTGYFVWFPDVANPVVAVLIVVFFFSLYFVLERWNVERTIATLARSLQPGFSGLPILGSLLDCASRLEPQRTEAGE